MKFHRNILALLLAFGIQGALTTNAQSDKPSWEIEMPARYARPIATALQEFQKHQRPITDKSEPVYGDLRHYTIQITPEGNQTEVRFVPEYGPKDEKEVTLGGRTQFGIEVAYHISEDGRKILKTTFAR
jgi:hypothetical protein